MALPIASSSSPSLRNRICAAQKLGFYRRRAVHCSHSASSIRTPHSGYHYDGSSRRFMEGWYFKVSLPKEKQSFAWMYSIEDPGCSTNGQFFTGTRKFPGVGAQILGADDEYLFQYAQDVNIFWASQDELALGATFVPKQGAWSPRTCLPSEEFRSTVAEGYQVNTHFHQGFLRDNGRTTYLKTVDSVEWEYTTQPVYGWGELSKQKSTAGWLAALPVFEPHWQICMAVGLSTGWIKWGDRRFDFENVPSYVEKNWGGTFPEKWFWVQCNVFEGTAETVALTAGGGKRGLPLVPGKYEEVAMIGVHHAGKFYEFVPWLGDVTWEISPWGSWKMNAYNRDFEVELQASTQSPGTILRAPTNDQGLAPFCKDTFSGCLELKIWERVGGVRGKVVLDVTSEMAALEVGGGPWYSTWKKSSTMQEPLRSLLRLEPDLDSFFASVPLLKPPGL